MEIKSRIIELYDGQDEVRLYLVPFPEEKGIRVNPPSGDFLIVDVQACQLEDGRPAVVVEYRQLHASEVRSLI